jgi:hypothetical protein
MYMIIVYDYICIIMCICVIFQFKTDVKLKWGCVEPLEHLFSAARTKPPKISLYYFRRLYNFGGYYGENW